MPAATIAQFADEIKYVLRKCKIVDAPTEPTVENQILDIVVNAWYSGREIGYREARDEEN